MGLMRMAPVARWAIVAAVLLGACGCFKYEEAIEINEDGSGVVRVHVEIREDMVARFRGEYEGSEAPPPLSPGLLNECALGSARVWTTKMEFELVNGVWVYDVELEFANLSSLGNTQFFKRRGLLLDYVKAKELRYRSTLSGNLVGMAMDKAKTLSQRTYADKFLVAAETEEFKALAGDAKLVYSVKMKGVSATGNAKEIVAMPDGLVSGRWEYTLAQERDAAAPIQMTLTAMLPAEMGFTPLVMGVLLAAAAGILISAIRLAVLKMKGMN